MSPSEQFEYCPRCAERRPKTEPRAPFSCANCGFLFYFNAAIAAAAFISDEESHVLFIRRAKAPGRGMLSIPGGFVDIGETAEDGLRRELREEVSLEVTRLDFLCTQPNTYHYQGVTYPVLDLFFVTQSVAGSTARALEDVESLSWLNPAEVSPQEIAFPSVRAGLEQLVAQRGRK